MKILHVSTSEFNGGAAVAAKRICNAQQKISEIESCILVQKKYSDDEYVFAISSTIKNRISIFNRILFDELSIRLLAEQTRGRFTFPYLGEDITKIDLVKNSDVINLHWINGGFLSLSSLHKLGELHKPVVWTLHDMWAFTGGCHYSSGCEKFLNNCSNCPSLFFKSDNDISNKIFNEKIKLFENLNLTIIACSTWLAKTAAKSRLFKNKKIYAIPNPLDISLFKPTEKMSARRILKLPSDKKLILIGAMNLKDKRKGFRFLIEALDIINRLNSKSNKQIELVVFGKLDENSLDKIPFKVHQLGKLKTEDKILMAYNSADVYVAPSLEDNLPNTIMEAMACGVPVVAFNVGGIPDMIDHMQNGILAEIKSSEDLAKGINLLLEDKELREKFSAASREKVVNNFNQKLVAEKYLEVYKSIL